MFCHFWQKFENSKWPPFLGRGKFFENWKRIHSLDTLWVENFDEIALSRTVKEIEANLCFAIFGNNSKIQNGRHFWGGEIFFENCKDYIPQIPCGSKISTKSLYLAWLKRWKQICVLPFLAIIRKFKMAAIFGEGKFFLKIAKITFLRYPVGRKFRRNRSISHG